MSGRSLKGIGERVPNADEELLDQVVVSDPIEHGELVEDGQSGALGGEMELPAAGAQHEVVLAAEDEDGAVEPTSDELDSVRWNDFLSKLTSLDGRQFRVRHTPSPAGVDNRRMTEAAALRQALAERNAKGGRRERVILAALAAAAAAGAFVVSSPASARQNPGPDGYAFERKEYTQTRLDVRIVEHASYRELLAAMPNGGPPRAVRKVQAWSNISPDGFCEIHIIDQSVSYTPEAIGHELAHCIYGRWHD